MQAVKTFKREDINNIVCEREVQIYDIHEKAVVTIRCRDEKTADALYEAINAALEQQLDDKTVVNMSVQLRC